MSQLGILEPILFEEFGQIRQFYGDYVSKKITRENVVFVKTGSFVRGVELLPLLFLY
jgi:hypothetical protein